MGGSPLESKTFSAAPQGKPPGVLAALLSYVESRSLLLSLEAQEAVSKIVRALIFAVIACIALFTGWLLGVAALAGVLMNELGWSWLKAVAILAGGHLLGALIFLLALWRLLASSHWFADTINEFKKDRTWLASQTGPN